MLPAFIPIKSSPVSIDPALPRFSYYVLGELGNLIFIGGRTSCVYHTKDMRLQLCSAAELLGCYFIVARFDWTQLLVVAFGIQVSIFTWSYACPCLNELFVNGFEMTR